MPLRLMTGFWSCGFSVWVSCVALCFGFGVSDCGVREGEGE